MSLEELCEWLGIECIDLFYLYDLEWYEFDFVFVEVFFVLEQLCVDGEVIVIGIGLMVLEVLVVFVCLVDFDLIMVVGCYMLLEQLVVVDVFFVCCEIRIGIVVVLVFNFGLLVLSEFCCDGCYEYGQFLDELWDWFVCIVVVCVDYDVFLLVVVIWFLLQFDVVCLVVVGGSCLVQFWQNVEYVVLEIFLVLWENFVVEGLIFVF